MQKTEKDSIYFEIQNLVCSYLELNKENIITTLVSDLKYLQDNDLTQKFCEAENFLRNLLWYLNSDGSSEPASLLGNIYNPIEIDFMDVLRKIFKVYNS